MREKLRKWIFSIRYAWFWSMNSKFYSGKDRVELLLTALLRLRPRHAIITYYPNHIPNIEVVKQLIYWFRTYSYESTLDYFGRYKASMSMTGLTLRRFERHLLFWRLLCEDENRNE